MNGAVLITGAASGIGRALALRMARAGHAMVLAGRDVGELERVAADVRIRCGVHVEAVCFDARDPASQAGFFQACVERASAADLCGVVLCHGYNGSQERAERDLDEARAIVETNFTSCALLLNDAAAYFEARGAGFIGAVSSVAGDRGRQSNYVYGASKAALNAFMGGLRNRLCHRARAGRSGGGGVSVLTVKPGFVDTAMTWGRPGLFLVASPQRVAADICRAIERRRHVVYSPPVWRFIMLAIRSIPEWLFKRMGL